MANLNRGFQDTPYYAPTDSTNVNRFPVEVEEEFEDGKLVRRITRYKYDDSYYRRGGMIYPNEVKVTNTNRCYPINMDVSNPNRSKVL